ncbi:hypothetical protein BG74_05440 [Sodalis-like endosymbiont of Proechinophthirus fluctus]|nr:hypothetical protein BG74_05440 [Sodalis-like endosymbiont of Proechinophthirus fluctus]
MQDEGRGQKIQIAMAGRTGHGQPRFDVGGRQAEQLREFQCARMYLPGLVNRGLAILNHH